MPVNDDKIGSCVVVTLHQTAALTSVQNDIGLKLGVEAAGLLTPLGNDQDGRPRYVLARPAWKLWLKTFDGDKTGAMTALRGTGGVAWVEKQTGSAVSDQLAKATGVPAPASSGSGWFLHNIRAPDAWEMFSGGVDGRAWRKIRVGHIDTGIAPHPAFGGGPKTSDSVLWEKGVNYKESGFPLDPLTHNGHTPYPGQPGHGTRTASVLAGNDSANGYYGVAPGVEIVPYRITDTVVIDTLGNNTALDRAIRHATVDASCRVLSISLGDPCRGEKGVAVAVAEAYEEGVIIVAAAGNITAEVTSPGRLSQVVTVSGVTRDDWPWHGASHGIKVDISAPAADVYRAEPLFPGVVVPPYYGGGGDGTSYATAQVAGAAALWLAYHGGAIKGAYSEGWQVVEAFRAALKGSARAGNQWPENEYGAGILDCKALLTAPLPAAAGLKKAPQR